MKADLRDALKTSDSVRISVLRSTLAAIANGEAVDRSRFDPHVTEVPRRLLTEEDIAAIVRAEHEDLLASASELVSLQQHERADELETQAMILAAYL